MNKENESFFDAILITSPYHQYYFVTNDAHNTIQSISNIKPKYYNREYMSSIFPKHFPYRDTKYLYKENDILLVPLVFRVVGKEVWNNLEQEQWRDLNGWKS